MSAPILKSALVVDDERTIADTLRMILSRAGYVAHAAYSAEHALEQVDGFAPDLLITDVMMPGKNGVELAIAIRQRYPQCKVLLYSGIASSAHLLVEARRQGYEFSFVEKPIHPAELLRRVS